MFQKAKLTPAQEKAWNDTRSALLWHAPAFSHIFYTLLQNNKDLDSQGRQLGAIFITNCPEVPIAATDGSNLVFNADAGGFFEYNLNQRVFIVVHEIFHCILNHAVLGVGFRLRGKVTYPDGSELPYSHRHMNIAEDYVINAIIVESAIGQMPTDKKGVQVGCFDTNIATSKDNSLDTYKKVYKDKQLPPSFDTVLAPGSTQGKNAVQAANERNNAAWATEVASGMNAAKAMGKLPAALERAFGELLEPKVDWSEQIRAMFARKVGSGAFDWQKPDRRMITRDIYAPGRTGFAAGTIVVGVDTSGSINDRTLDMFMAEMSGILEDVRPEKLVIIWCDAEVNRVDECEDSEDLMILRAKGSVGGGGTDFRPVFDAIDEEGITCEALVYLTDGLGTFPSAAPSYPVIWGSIYDGAKYPFGDVVNIPKQA